MVFLLLCTIIRVVIYRASTVVFMLVVKRFGRRSLLIIVRLEMDGAIHSARRCLWLLPTEVFPHWRFGRWCSVTVAYGFSTPFRAPACTGERESRSPEPGVFEILYRERANKVFGKRYARLLKTSSPRLVLRPSLVLRHTVVCNINRRSFDCDVHLSYGNSSKARKKDATEKEDQGRSNANMVQKFSRAGKNNNKGKNKPMTTTTFKKKKNKAELKCFTCGELGHFSKDCPDRADRKGNKAKKPKDVNMSTPFRAPACTGERESRSPEPVVFEILYRERANKVFGKRYARLLKTSSPRLVLRPSLVLRRTVVCNINRRSSDCAVHLSYGNSSVFFDTLCRMKPWIMVMTGFVYLFLPETNRRVCMTIEQIGKVWRQHWFERRVMDNSFPFTLEKMRHKRTQYTTSKLQVPEELTCAVGEPLESLDGRSYQLFIATTAND
ncbi:hypothetical protein HU200_048719 [Digitaria exilis]|uniref:CCHC-type domain-containing protein n=1 Tax=Digitaria exilis TaxID=1010633 RepID=A0A835AZV9_9POAL|nr:hypothetical protein HU200_048719 [Digitaria exilis]